MVRKEVNSVATLYTDAQYWAASCTLFAHGGGTCQLSFRASGVYLSLRLSTIVEVLPAAGKSRHQQLISNHQSLDCRVLLHIAK